MWIPPFVILACIALKGDYIYALSAEFIKAWVIR
jgi:hypothetical protein